MNLQNVINECARYEDNFFAFDRPSKPPPRTALRFFISHLHYVIEGFKVGEFETFETNQNKLKFQCVLVGFENLELTNFRALC